MAQSDSCNNQKIAPSLVIKKKVLIDKRNKVSFIIGTTQTIIEARRKNGDLIWRTNPWNDNKLHAFMINLCPYIVIFDFENDERTNNKEAIMIGYNLTHFGYLDKKNGKFTFLGND